MAFLFAGRQNASDRAAQPKPFGTLLGVRHESSGGSMSFRSEFEIEVLPQEIVSCAYWPQDCAQEMVRKAHVPVKESDWDDVVQTVQTLWPLFQEVKPETNKPPMPDMRILDGGDYSRWFLTRQTPDGRYTAQYEQPDDRRILTLITLLRELAEPIGREIPRYDPPVLCGIYFQNTKQNYSYQCTPWGDGKDGYRFIVYDVFKGGKRSVYEHVGNAVWEEAFAFLEMIRLDQFPKSGSQNAVSCTLYYSDGKQHRVVPDKKTAGQMQTFFAGLTDRLGNK